MNHPVHPVGLSHLSASKKYWLCGICWPGLLALAPACISNAALPPVNFPFEPVLQKQDLPDGWFKDTGPGQALEPNSPGALAASRVEFGAWQDLTVDGWRKVDHQLTVYPSETTAQKAYAWWKSRWFPADDWKRPLAAAFVPMDPTDQFFFACMDETISNIPIMACGYLQQHRYLVSFLIVNIDGKVITLAQFEHTLGEIDQRLQTIQGTSAALATVTALP